MIVSDVAKAFAVTSEWIFACFSFALFASALVSLMAGRLMDTHGAGTTMKVASVVGAASLGLAAIAWNVAVFAIALFGMQVASAFLFYEAAFVFLVQRDVGQAKRQITTLTLIVGFSSTLFWPLTDWLLALISWRGVFAIYMVADILVALPLIVWAVGTGSVHLTSRNDDHQRQVSSAHPPKMIDVALIAIGFSLTTFILSAYLGQMIPILSSLGLGATAPWISALFGPSQVLIRFFAASLTSTMPPVKLTLLSSILLSVAGPILELSSGTVFGAVIFMVLLGFSSGLNSICRGTLPLSVFGSHGYGRRVALITGVRLLTASVAPLVYSVIQQQSGATIALAALTACGLGSILAFVLLAALQPVSDGRLPL
ncbi:MFS transporter [Sinorhizobium terangae]|uniref:MFS transporter n=1 Tax=Sinorhizobium terangae TaxID=110322 RepID=UPI0024B27676|nr:MFS transporter [Sinorhizobium terangae]WFU51750.1 MFS transporter [Sinorhizobium terangae]